MTNTNKTKKVSGITSKAAFFETIREKGLTEETIQDVLSWAGLEIDFQPEDGDILVVEVKRKEAA